MDSSLNRLNSLAGITSLVLLTAGLLCHLTVYVRSPSISGKLSFAKGELSVVSDSGKNHDSVPVSMNLSYDLHDVFDWNVSVVYLYAVASYSTIAHPVDEVLIWDRILRSPKDALVKNSVTNASYPLADKNLKTLAGANMRFRLKAQIIPIMGRIRNIDIPGSEITIAVK